MDQCCANQKGLTAATAAAATAAGFYEIVC